MTPSNDVLSITGVDQLFRWNVSTLLGTPVVVTFSFGTERASYDTDSRPGYATYSEAHKASVRIALSKWADKSGVSFVEVTDGTDGQIRFSMFDMTGLNNASGNQLSGYAYYPQYQTFSSGKTEQLYNNIGGDVFLNANYYATDPNSISPGIRGFSILIHEIGHAIGLKHPFSGTPVIQSDHDNGIYTVMSYDRSQSATELGTVDIEATQLMYSTQSYSTSFDPKTNTLIQTGTAAGETMLGIELNDVLYGLAGNDILLAGSGTDILVGGLGNDALDGGDGTDTAYFTGNRADYTITKLTGTSFTITDTTTGRDGTDTVINIETFRFADQTIAVADALTIDWKGDAAAIEIVASTYQFFTQKAPGAPGFEYLISSIGNIADLNDTYYAQFNTENRYINFANNLGVFGEGKDAFTTKYGALTFQQTIQTIFEEIISSQAVTDNGKDPQDSLNFFYNAYDFYAAIAQERVVPTGISLDLAVKVVAVGSILNEAMKENLGLYSNAVDVLANEISTTGTSNHFGQDLFA